MKPVEKELEHENELKIDEVPKPNIKVTQKSDKKRILQVFRGVLFALLSGFCYSIASLILKHMKDIHPGQIALYRCLGIFVFSLPTFAKRTENHLGPPKSRLLIVIRSLVGGTCIFLHFMAFRYLPLGEAATIIFSYPVFVTLMARIFLKEPCRVSQTIITCASVVGTSFVAGLPEQIVGNISPYENKDRLYGVIFAVASILFTSTQAILLRKLRNVHEAINLFHYSWIAAFTSIALMFAFGGSFALNHQCGEFRGYLIIVLGLSSYGSQLFFTMAFQCEAAGPITTMRAASDILMNFIWQTTIYHEVTGYYGIAGTIIISLCIMLIGVQKWLFEQPEHSTVRKRLRWLIY